MSKTYDPIATTTLTTTQETVTFSNIAGSYTDIIYVVSGGGSTNLRLRFNSDTGTNYSFTQLYGTGSSALSLRDSNTNYAIGGVTQSFGLAIGHIMNYSNTTTNKTLIGRGGSAGNTFLDACVSLWRNTSAITSISFSPEFNGVNTFTSGTTFTLYGIKAE